MTPPWRLPRPWRRRAGHPAQPGGVRVFVTWMTCTGAPLAGPARCGGACGKPDCAGFLLACDCGLVAHLLVTMRATATEEAAVTCGGCMATTWFMVSAS